MKNVLLSALVALGTLSQVTAAPLVSGTLSDYIALGLNGGEIGTTRFSEFTLLPGQTGAMQIAPSEVMVNPLNNPNLPGLQFVINDGASDADLFGVAFPTASRRVCCRGQRFRSTIRPPRETARLPSLKT